MDKMMQNLRRWWLVGLLPLLMLQAGWAQQWVLKTPMPTPRKGMAVAVLDGKIWVIGGRSMGHHGCDQVEVYDPQQNLWSTQYPEIQYKREYATAQVWEGKIFLFGGRKQSMLVAAVEMYDPAVGAWQTVAQMPNPRFGMASVVYDSLIYLIGGSTAGSGQISEVLRFNPADYSWSTLPASMNYSRISAMAGVPEGQLVVAGGFYYGPIAAVEQYLPGSNSWQNLDNLPYPCGGAGYATLGNRLWIVGGHTQYGITNNVLVGKMEGNSLQWDFAPPLNLARKDLAVAIVDNTIYAIGGQGEFSGILYNTVEALDVLVGLPHGSDSAPLIREFALSAYPNPFNATTMIQVKVPEAGNFRLALYDLLGRQVAEVYRGFLLPGQHRFPLDMKNISGLPTGGGIYFLRAEGHHHSATIRILYLK
jgi:hypothetical protein